MSNRPSVFRAPASAALTVGAGAVAALTSQGLRHRGRIRRRHEPTSRVGTVDGPLLASTVRGELDAPGTIVLVHGWTMTSRFWTATAEALVRRGWRVVTYDQRGHGRSTGPDGLDGFGLSRLGADLQAVLDAHVPIDHPAVLVGHSMGAMSVMAWAGQAGRDRHDVRGAVLTNTSAHQVLPDAVEAITGTGSEPVRALLRQVVRVPIEVPRTPLNMAITRHIAFGDDPPASAVRLTHQLFLECAPTVRVGFAHEIERLDVRDGAAALDLPTVLLTGSQDRLTPPGHSEELAQLLPDATLRTVEGAGHQLPLERPEVFVNAASGHAHRVVVAGRAERPGAQRDPLLPVAEADDVA